VPSVAMPEKSMATPKKRHTFRRIVLWLFVLCIGFEIGLRAFGYGRYIVYRPDQRLLWVPIPGSNKLTEIHHLPINVTSQGFRYHELLALSHPGIYRMFAFGDSVTMGWGVADNATYSADLERLLNSQACGGKAFQVISAGVNAYPNALVFERMKKVIEDNYQPDAVVVAYSFNTGFEGLPDLQGKEREKFLRRVELKSIARRSAIYNFVIEDLLREIVYYRFRELLMQGSWNTAKSKPDLPVEHYTKGLEGAWAVAQAHHVQMILLLLGSDDETGPEHPYQEEMLKFAQEKQLPIVNMIDVMRSQNLKAMFMDHVHPTAAGHELIAEQLLTAVRATESYSAACQNGKDGGAVTGSQPASPIVHAN
jgi:lysophospholipase L1-like esterase